MSRDFKKKPIWPALSSGSKRKGRPPFHSLRSFHYEHPFLSLAADAAFTETTLHYRPVAGRESHPLDINTFHGAQFFGP